MACNRIRDGECLEVAIRLRDKTEALELECICLNSIKIHKQETRRQCSRQLAAALASQSSALCDQCIIIVASHFECAIAGVR